MKRRDFLKGVAALGSVALFSKHTLSNVLLKNGNPKTVIIGATAVGCAMALRDPENTLVLERGIHPAPEFLLSLDPETPGTAGTEKSRAFEKILKERNLIENGKLYHQPVADLFSKFLADNGVNLLFCVEFVGMKKLQTGGYQITVCGNDGKTSFEAEKVVDLRFGKTLAMSGVLAKKGCGDTKIFRVPIAENATISQARLKFHDEWEKCAKNFPDWELVAEAGSLKYDTGFPDFFSAMDFGFRTNTLIES